VAPPPARRLDEDAVWATIDRERQSLADLLDGLTPDQWAQPSLCDGWTVRDVTAHLALAQTGSARALAELIRARGSFPRMIRDSARRHACVPTEQLVAEIRAMVGSRRRAPGVSHLEPLLDVLVHTQDVALPLGLTRRMPVDAAATAATRVWTMPWPVSTAFPIRRRLRACTLVASDTAWSAGTGPRIDGPMEALLLLLTGRTAALPRLTGPGVAGLSPASPDAAAPRPAG
jgi:uncharacterized protein (TIGR03083 family)